MTRIYPDQPARYTSHFPPLHSLGFSRIPARQTLDHLDSPLPKGEDYEAYFCPVDGFWKRAHKPEAPAPIPPPPPAPKPISDGSGRMWRVVDRHTQRVLWTFAAHTFEMALHEKRRLCTLSGGKSGYCVLERAGQG